MNGGRGLGIGGGRGRGRGMGGGGGHGMGKGLGCGRGKGTGPGSQPGSARAATAAPTDETVNRPAPVEIGGYRRTAIVCQDRCASCGACVDACPEHAISMNGLVVVDSKRCTGCGECIALCPNEALLLGWHPPGASRNVAG